MTPSQRKDAQRFLLTCAAHVLAPVLVVGLLAVLGSVLEWL